MTTVSTGPTPIGGYFTKTFSKPDVTAGGATAWTTANSALTIFTVTGTVFMKVYGVVGGTALTSTGGLGTLQLGVAGSTGLFLPLSAVSAAGQFAIASTWVGATPTIGAVVPLLANLTGIYNTAQNVILTVATADMTAGAMTLVANWIPITAGATVV